MVTIPFKGCDVGVVLAYAHSKLVIESTNINHYPALPPHPSPPPRTVPRNHAKTAAGEEIPNSAEDFFLSARSSATTWTIALSFFASGMGAWVVYGTTEMGATVDLSWLGVIGYSMASACPAVIISLIGPRIREMR